MRADTLAALRHHELYMAGSSAIVSHSLGHAPGIAVLGVDGAEAQRDDRRLAAQWAAPLRRLCLG